MKHMPKQRELIHGVWKPGALAMGEQGRRFEILSNPCMDHMTKRFRILIRACPGELPRLTDLNALR